MSKRAVMTNALMVEVMNPEHVAAMLRDRREVRRAARSLLDHAEWMTPYGPVLFSGEHVNRLSSALDAWSEEQEPKDGA